MLEWLTSNLASKKCTKGETLKKDSFIKKILRHLELDVFRIVRCTYYVEWTAVEAFSQRCCLPMTDDMGEHIVLYYGVHCVGYAHIVFHTLEEKFLLIWIPDGVQRKVFMKAFITLLTTWLESTQSSTKEMYTPIFMKPGVSAPPQRD